MKITSPLLYSSLHTLELNIPKTKWEHLQQLKSIIQTQKLIMKDNQTQTSM